MPIAGLLKKKKQAIEEAVHPSREGPARPPAEHDESNWLVSYADMMTLLCGFFIMLFSMSTLKKPEYDKVKTEVEAHFKGIDEKVTSQAIPLLPQKTETPVQKPEDRVQEQMEKMVQELKLEKEVEVRKDQVGVSVVFQSSIFFDSANSYLRDEGRGVLAQMIQGIQREQTSSGKKFKFVIEGHTDSRPVLSGEFPSNWELSSARATQVLQLFIENGFEPASMLAVGYGGTRPELTDRDESGQFIEQALSKNRRVVVRVLPGEADSIPWNMSESKREPASAAATPPAESLPASTPAPSAPVSPAH